MSTPTAPRFPGCVDRHLLPDPTDDPSGAAERERLRTAYPRASPGEPDQPAAGVAVVLALLGPLLVWGTGVWLGAGAVPSKVGAGQCQGIGFGCQLSPRDGVLFFGGLVGLFVVPVTTAVAVVVGTRGSAPERLGRVVLVLVLLAFGVALFAATQVASPPNR